MKKLLYIIPILLGMALTSCYDDEIEKINSRLDNIENTQIATISQQITSINNSILLLNSTDKELKDYIAALEAEAENLQSQITATNTKIDDVKTEVLSTISSEKAELLADLEELRSKTSARLEEINTAITELQAADSDMSAQIEALEAEAEALEAKLAETNTKIDNVKNELSETISTEKANILAELEAFKATVNVELDAIKAVLETLKAKDAELEEQIADLKEYVDTELKATEDWATATFATLEQYEAVTTSIATINGLIEGLNESLAALETRLGEKIAKDIETACATLSTDLQNAVSEVTTAYTAAIATTKQGIEEAYTAAIKAAIAISEASMKKWVNEQLAGYYTIAQIDSKIYVLKTIISSGDVALQKEIDALETSLAKQKTEITEAYQNAIAEAITANNGVIDEKIAAGIKTVNDTITDLEKRLDQLESRITTLEENFTNQQEQLTALVNRIQSVSYIPRYSDGKATIDKERKLGVFDFRISPKEAVAELEKVWENALSMQAVHTQTRAVLFIELPITYFETDSTNGTFTIEIDATDLGDKFYTSEIGASVALNVSDGNDNLASSYINLALGTVKSLKDTPANNEIWYTSTDGEIINPQASTLSVFGANIVSNTYESDKGVILFDNKVTSIGNHAFYYNSRLVSITIPNSVTSIGNRAFGYCTNLTSVSIPNSVTSIGEMAFGHCTDLTSISIPNSVTSIGDGAFSDCSRLLQFVGKFASYDNRCLVIDGVINSFAPAGRTGYTIPNGVTSIGEWAFGYCTNLTSITIPNSVTSIESRAFIFCESLIDITIPDSVTSIGESAFSGCSKLESATIGSNVISIDSYAFDSSELKTIYCRANTPPKVYYTYSYPTGDRGSFPFNSGIKIYVPRNSYNTYAMYRSISSDKTVQTNWYAYKSYIEPYDFE